MSGGDAGSLKKIVWEIRRAMPRGSGALTIQDAILALADCFDRRNELLAPPITAR